MNEDGSLTPGESEAFSRITESLGMDNMPPSEEEARAYLGNAQYDKLAAFNDAANQLTLLINSSVAMEQQARARMWKANAFFLRMGGLSVVAWVIYRMFH